MSGSREDPDIPFEVWQELNVDVWLIARHKIPECAHRVLRIKLRSDLAKWIARAHCNDAVICVQAACLRAHSPTRSLAVEPHYACLLDLCASSLGAAQEH